MFYMTQPLLPYLSAHLWSCLDGAGDSLCLPLIWKQKTQGEKKAYFAAECHMQMAELLIKLNQGPERLFLSSLTTERILLESSYGRVVEFALQSSSIPLCLGLTRGYLSHEGKSSGIIKRNPQKRSSLFLVTVSFLGGK